MSSNLDNGLLGFAGLPEPLPGDPRRQAVYSIQGVVYQAWWSIDAWLGLCNAEQVIYLEGAEDFDIVRKETAIPVQVRHNTGTISLGTAKALEALDNFWILACQEANRHVEFHYLTTSSIAAERDTIFGETKGIEIWRAAQTNIALVGKIKEYLIGKLNTDSALRAFLTSACSENIQTRLIQRFHWITDQPDIDAVKKSIDDRITVLLHNQRRSLNLVPNARRYLESRFWEIILETKPINRCLTYGDLLRQVDAATTTYLPVPVEKVPDLLAHVHPGLSLLNLLLEKVPSLPEPLLQRPALTQAFEKLVTDRKAVLLTGTVHKGKTTVAQLVSLSLCPDAWWISLTGRQSDQIDNVLLALSGRIESNDCPSLIIVDDLDVNPAAYRVYRDSLSLVLHRAKNKGRGMILTAQGSSTNSAVLQDFRGLVLFEIPELTFEEIAVLCSEHGCPHELTSSWGQIIGLLTGGHPKLVQVRLADLHDEGWPKPGLNDLITESVGVKTVHQIARQLLGASVAAPIAEFVYVVSEATMPLHRSVAISLSERFKGVNNGGDVLDNLSGKWLERIEGEWFRATTLLKGAASEVWSQAKLKRAHILLYDAISSKHTLSQFEAAELLFHAYLGGEPARLATTAMRFQTIDDRDTRREIERQLLWLPFIALQPGQLITDDPMAGSILRGLQFRVAATLDSDSLPDICARWTEEINRILHPEARTLNELMMWFGMSITESNKVPLNFRLDAVVALPALMRKSSYPDFSRKFFENGLLDGLPENGTVAQALLLIACRSIRGLEALKQLLHWLDTLESDDIRQEFDAMLQWRLVQQLGAFVQGAWVVVHEQTKDWAPWLSLLESIDGYSKRRLSPCFGREAAKARAIILSEYLERGDEALKALDEAEKSFGSSIILMEQRANVLFQKRDDASVLKLWDELNANPDKRPTLDPFAYRRAAISAARLKDWDKAELIFYKGADSMDPGSLERIKFGLMVDAAWAGSLAGRHADAARLLTDAILNLPAGAAAEGDAQWEALERAAVATCGIIENNRWKGISEPLLAPGYASSPDLRVPDCTPGQAARTEMTKVQILHLMATFSEVSARADQELDALTGSRYLIVRRLADEARLARAYSTGAGSGFIEKLVTFDRSIFELSAAKDKDISLLTPDEGRKLDAPVAPERWFGLLCAGAICTGLDLLTNLEIWLNESRQILGEQAALVTSIQLPERVNDNETPLIRI